MLNELDLPLGVVTSINGSVRYVGEVVGIASHAGTTPMDRRRDAATAVAELALFVEKRAAQAEPHLVGTVGMLEVPNGSINVVPGRCKFSLDVRAPDRRGARRLRRRRARRAAGASASAAASRFALAGDHARRRRAERARMAAALGTRRRRARPAASTACPAAPATTR